VQGLSLVQAPLQLFRRANDEVHRERRGHGKADSERLIKLIPDWHDY
jgi:hypothetical protein